MFRLLVLLALLIGVWKGCETYQDKKLNAGLHNLKRRST